MEIKDYSEFYTFRSMKAFSIRKYIALILNVPIFFRDRIFISADLQKKAEMVMEKMAFPLFSILRTSIHN